MKSYSANEAKQGLGEVMDHAQREPVLINKHGRPFAVVVSYEDYQAAELAKLEALRVAAKVGLDQLDRGEGQPFDPEGHKQRLQERLAEGRKATAP